METPADNVCVPVRIQPFLGGPAYDALIAFTAAEHQATLLSLDQRATATYEAVGATVEQLVPWPSLGRMTVLTSSNACDVHFDVRVKYML